MSAVSDNLYDTHPAADSRVPANNRAGDPGVVADLSVGENHAALQTDTLADLDTGADGDIRANDSGWVDLGSLESDEQQNILTGSTRTFPPYTHLFFAGSDRRGECWEVRWER